MDRVYDKPGLEPFVGFPKMGRLSRQCVITEKIDGTNAQLYITEGGRLLTGSRNRWIQPGADNYGFALWASQHREELMTLGPGRHFGEWWGQGIQRRYGLSERRFSLFNATRWCPHGQVPQEGQDVVPGCCHVVPILYVGEFTTDACSEALERLRLYGSAAAPGFMDPEGIVCFHTAAKVGFKKTLNNDGQPKSMLGTS